MLSYRKATAQGLNGSGVSRKPEPRGIEKGDPLTDYRDKKLCLFAENRNRLEIQKMNMIFPCISLVCCPETHTH